MNSRRLASATRPAHHCSATNPRAALRAIKVLAGGTVWQISALVPPVVVGAAVADAVVSGTAVLVKVTPIPLCYAPTSTMTLPAEAHSDGRGLPLVVMAGRAAT